MEQPATPFRLETDVTGRLKALGIADKAEAKRIAGKRHLSETGKGVIALSAIIFLLLMILYGAIDAIHGMHAGAAWDAAAKFGGLAILVAGLLTWVALLYRSINQQSRRDLVAMTMSWDGATTDIASDRFTITKAEGSRTYHLAAVTAFDATPEYGMESLRIHLLQGHVDVPCVQPGPLAERFKDMLREHTTSATTA